MGGIVDMFCNQSVVWQRRIPNSEDMFGVPQYTDGEFIKVRLVPAHKEIRTKVGDVVVLSYSVLSVNDIKVGDKITSGDLSFVVVHQSADVVWINGETWGRWVFG